MSSPALRQVEIALHYADCQANDGPEVCPGHGDRYQKMAEAVIKVFPPDREPWWLRDRKLIQEASLEIIITELREIKEKLDA